MPKPKEIADSLLAELLVDPEIRYLILSIKVKEPNFIVEVGSNLEKRARQIHTLVNNFDPSIFDFPVVGDVVLDTTGTLNRIGAIVQRYQDTYKDLTFKVESSATATLEDFTSKPKRIYSSLGKVGIAAKNTVINSVKKKFDETTSAISLVGTDLLAKNLHGVIDIKEVLAEARHAVAKPKALTADQFLDKINKLSEDNHAWSEKERAFIGSYRGRDFILLEHYWRNNIRYFELAVAAGIPYTYVTSARSEKAKQNTQTISFYSTHGQARIGLTYTCNELKNRSDRGNLSTTPAPGFHKDQRFEGEIYFSSVKNLMDQLIQQAEVLESNTGLSEQQIIDLAKPMIERLEKAGHPEWADFTFTTEIHDGWIYIN